MRLEVMPYQVIVQSCHAWSSLELLFFHSLQTTTFIFYKDSCLHELRVLDLMKPLREITLEAYHTSSEL